ncbi:MAG: sigma-70 family RNA polymerase sigma factor [Phycisphaerales bacterium]|nr:sigma-70 family RNA polymerase sigma factor [Phycisphaerales bacterium]
MARQTQPNADSPRASVRKSSTVVAAARTETIHAPNASRARETTLRSKPVRKATLSKSPATKTAAPAHARSTPAAKARGLSLGEKARLAQIITQISVKPMDFMASSEFELEGAESRILANAPSIERPDVTWYRPLMDDFISARHRRARTANSQSTVLLTGAQERVLFLKYNYARWRVRQVQNTLTDEQGELGKPSVGQAREMIKFYDLSKQFREQIAETNLALVLAMAKRVRNIDVDLSDLIGEGNMALMRSVDKFDCMRGFKFSTYACRAILKAFSRYSMKVAKNRSKIVAEFDPNMERSNHLETVRAQSERDSAREARHLVETDCADLSQLEKQVITSRFGLEKAPGTPQATLEQVGREIGLTKERVRQIQNRALEKLRTALESRPTLAQAPAPNQN